MTRQNSPTNPEQDPHESVTGGAVAHSLQENLGLLKWVLLAALIIYLFSGIRFVGPQESALVLRFGKLLPQVYESGLVFAFPKPIDTVITVPTQTVHELRLTAWTPSELTEEDMPTQDEMYPGDGPIPGSAEAGNEPTGDLFAEQFDTVEGDAPQFLAGSTLHPVDDGYTLTGDANIIRAEFSVRYRISNPVAWELGVDQPEALLEALIFRALTQVIAGMGVDGVLTVEQGLLRQRTLVLAQQFVDDLQLGATLETIEIHQIKPARQVIDAFEEVISAQVEARTIHEQALSYADSVMQNAEALGYRNRQQAAAAAEDVTQQARGEASSFVALLTEYQRQPQLVRHRMFSEALEAIYSSAGNRSILSPGSREMRLYMKSNPTAPGTVIDALAPLPEEEAMMPMEDEG